MMMTGMQALVDKQWVSLLMHDQSVSQRNLRFRDNGLKKAHR